MAIGCIRKVKVTVAQSCLTLCDPMNYIVHGILQARILEWIAFSFPRRSSQPRDQTQVSCIAGGFFTSSATREDLQCIGEMLSRLFIVYSWSGISKFFLKGTAFPFNWWNLCLRTDLDMRPGWRIIIFIAITISVSPAQYFDKSIPPTL